MVCGHCNNSMLARMPLTGSVQMHGSSAKDFLSCKSWAAFHWGFCNIAITDWIAHM